MFLCNALVLVMFVYRLFHKPAVDLEYFMAEGRGIGTGNNAVEFTTFIDLPSRFSSRAHPVTSGVQSKGDATYSSTPGGSE